MLTVYQTVSITSQTIVTRTNGMSIHDLTVDRLKELFHYSPTTGEFTWLCRPTPRATQIVVGSKAGHVRHEGYVYIYIGKNQHKAHRLAWMYMYGVTPKIIDHINGDRSDNRITNLRLATRSLNNQNKTVSRSKSLKLLGVFETKKGDFSAKIKVTLAGIPINLYLGTYSSSEKAYEVYNAAKELMHPDALSGRGPSIP